MKLKVVGLVGLALIISCSSSTKVGEGPNLDSLATEPTAVQLTTAFAQADYGVETPPITALGSGVANCPGGGKLSFSSVTINEDVKFEGNFSNAGVTIVLNNENYDVKMDGKLTLEITSDGNEKTVVYKSNMSISGDLGLAGDCDVLIENAQTFDSAIFTGKCTFKDNAGNQVEATAKQLKDILHYGI